MIEVLTVTEVLALHRDLSKRFGGSDMVRDVGAIIGALARANSAYYPSTVEKAAAMWESLFVTKPFVEGNERTAFASAIVFLHKNGMRLEVALEEALAFLENLKALNAFSYVNLLHGLKSRVKASS